MFQIHYHVRLKICWTGIFTNRCRSPHWIAGTTFHRACSFWLSVKMYDLVNILGDVIVTRLNEGFICGQFKRNFLLSLPRRTDERIFTTHEYDDERSLNQAHLFAMLSVCCLDIPSFQLGTSWEVFGTWWGFTPLDMVYASSEILSLCLNHNWTHQMGQLSQIFPSSTTHSGYPFMIEWNFFTCLFPHFPCIYSLLSLGLRDGLKLSEYLSLGCDVFFVASWYVSSAPQYAW